MTTAVNVGNHRTRLAAGDTHGYLRLFQYPCTSPRAEYQVSHSQHVIFFITNEWALLASITFFVQLGFK